MDHLAPSVALADDLAFAARAFFPEATAIEVVPGHPDIARVDVPDGPRRVRRWPQAAPLSDVVFSHDVMATARAAGLSVVPPLVPLPDSAETALQHDRRLFDAQEWMPGAPAPRSQSGWPEPDQRIDLPVVLPAPLFATVVTALAALHAAMPAFAARPEAPAAPLATLPDIVRQAQGRQFASLRARAPREPAIQRWLSTGERLLAAAEPIVAEAGQNNALAKAVLHMNLWPAHLLIEGDTLSGWLGWEQVAVGSPLIDLAQAIVRLQGWSEEAVETAFAAYGAAFPLPPAERRLLPAVAALDVVATTGHLLTQAFPQRVTERPPSSVRAGIDAMLRSMSALEHGLTIATAKRPRRTPFHRGPRPPHPAKGARRHDRRR